MDDSQLTAGLKAAEPQTRLQSAEALATMSEAAAPASLQLLEAVGDGDQRVSEAATAALEGMGPPSVDSVDALAEKLSHPEASVAYWAATLLGRLESQAAGAVQTLCAVLANNSTPTQVRQRSAWALGCMGPAAGASLETLQSAQQESDPRLARLATRAIESIQQ